MDPKEEKLHKYAEGFKKTGFLFESDVADFFRARGWMVHHHSLYIDDLTAKPREQDLIAIKESEFDGVLYKTALLISCKKDEELAWSFLCSDLDAGPAFYPRQAATEKILKHGVLQNHYDLMHHMIQRLEPLPDIFKRHDGVRSYTLLKKSNGRPDSAKSIYSSVESLVKAVSYHCEPGKMQTRNVVLTCVLISLLRGQLVRVRQVDKDVVADYVDQLVYRGNHIVRGFNSSYQIIFSSDEKLGELEADCSRFHEWQAKVLAEYREIFFQNLKHRTSMYHVLIPEFEREVAAGLNTVAHAAGLAHNAIRRVYAYPPDDDSVLIVYIDQRVSLGNNFFARPDAKDMLAQLAKRWFRYSGKLRIVSDPREIKRLKEILKRIEEQQVV